jgi:hypothetical protein
MSIVKHPLMQRAGHCCVAADWVELTVKQAMFVPLDYFEVNSVATPTLGCLQTAFEERGSTPDSKLMMDQVGPFGNIRGYHSFAFRLNDFPLAGPGLTLA